MIESVAVDVGGEGKDSVVVWLGCGLSLLGDLHMLPGHSPLQPALGGPPGAGIILLCQSSQLLVGSSVRRKGSPMAPAFSTHPWYFLVAGDTDEVQVVVLVVREYISCT